MPLTKQRKIQIKVLKITCAVALVLIVAGESVAQEDVTSARLAAGEARKAPFNEKQASSGARNATEEENLHKTSGKVERRPIRPDKKLTIRQKRIFVLGLGSSEKN